VAAKGEEPESEFTIDDETLDTLEENDVKLSVIEMLREALAGEDRIRIAYEED